VRDHLLVKTRALKICSQNLCRRKTDSPRRESWWSTRWSIAHKGEAFTKLCSSCWQRLRSICMVHACTVEGLALLRASSPGFPFGLQSEHRRRPGQGAGDDWQGGGRRHGEGCWPRDREESHQQVRDNGITWHSAWNVDASSFQTNMRH